MEVNKKIQDIIERHERGYTNTLYGNSFYSSLQRDTDFDELIKEVKKMNVMQCSTELCVCKGSGGIRMDGTCGRCNKPLEFTIE